METFLIILPIILVVAVVFYLLDRRLSALAQPADDAGQKLMLQTIENLRQELGSVRKEISHTTGESRKELQNRLDKTLDQITLQFTTINKSVDQKLSENTKVLGERLDNAARVIGAVKGELGKMQEIGESVKSFTDFLRHSKRRGTLGEEGLQDMLADALPSDKFQMQYKFRSGETVDAIVKTTNGLIPIDAKFPLENFRAFVNSESDAAKETARKEFVKDVKKHIDAIAKKYILSDEGTTEFAVMYVPAESIHYEATIMDDSLVNYARAKRVHLVSPSSLFYFLRVIMIAFQSQKIEENAKQVLNLIAGVKQESVKFGENLSVLARHVTNAKTKMDETVSGYQKLETRIDRVSELSDSTPEPVTTKAQKLELPLGE